MKLKKCRHCGSIPKRIDWGCVLDNGSGNYQDGSINCPIKHCYASVGITIDIDNFKKEERQYCNFYYNILII